MAASALDPEGYFHTGDVAEITKEGAITLIGRKYNIVKLASGGACCTHALGVHTCASV